MAYGVFWQWRNEGLWQKLHDRLREKTRRRAGKKPTPTVAILDSQSVRTVEGGEQRGYDAGKKIPGRKRHLAVDTLGLILAVVVHGADWQDQHGACWVLEELNQKFHRLVIFAMRSWPIVPARLRQRHVRATSANDSAASRAEGLFVLTKRWIVERTFAWLARYRRHSRDYERTVRLPAKRSPYRHDRPHVQTPRTTTKMIFKTRSKGDVWELADYQLPAFDTWTKQLQDRCLANRSTLAVADAFGGRSIVAGKEIEYR